MKNIYFVLLVILISCVKPKYIELHWTECTDWCFKSIQKIHNRHMGSRSYFLAVQFCEEIYKDCCGDMYMETTSKHKAGDIINKEPCDRIKLLDQQRKED